VDDGGVDSTLRQGDFGPAVGELQQKLLEAGLSVPSSELAAERFGPGTASAVERFQRASLLAVDRIVGPKTRAALASPGGAFVPKGWRSDIDRAPAEAVEPLRAAVGEIGCTEQPPGSNRGPRVDAYTAPDLGVPWCAAFLSWCYRKAPSGSPFGRILSAWGMSRWGETKNRVLPSGARPAPGDIGIILRAPDASGERHGHVALIAGEPWEGRVSTVEGNAQNAVRGRIRDVADFHFIVRPVGVMPTANRFV
jgi:Putative peptidoglycan binding domain/CHAP domain